MDLSLFKNLSPFENHTSSKHFKFEIDYLTKSNEFNSDYNADRSYLLCQQSSECEFEMIKTKIWEWIHEYEIDYSKERNSIFKFLIKSKAIIYNLSNTYSYLDKRMSLSNYCKTLILKRILHDSKLKDILLNMCFNTNQHLSNLIQDLLVMFVSNNIYTFRLCREILQKYTLTITVDGNNLDKQFSEFIENYTKLQPIKNQLKLLFYAYNIQDCEYKNKQFYLDVLQKYIIDVKEINLDDKEYSKTFSSTLRKCFNSVYKNLCNHDDNIFTSSVFANHLIRFYDIYNLASTKESRFSYNFDTIIDDNPKMYEYLNVYIHYLIINNKDISSIYKIFNFVKTNIDMFIELYKKYLEIRVYNYNTINIGKEITLITSIKQKFTKGQFINIDQILVDTSISNNIKKTLSVIDIEKKSDKYKDIHFNVNLLNPLLVAPYVWTDVTFKENKYSTNDKEINIPLNLQVYTELFQKFYKTVIKRHSVNTCIVYNKGYVKFDININDTNVSIKCTPLQFTILECFFSKLNNSIEDIQTKTNIKSDIIKCNLNIFIKKQLLVKNELYQVNTDYTKSKSIDLTFEVIEITNDKDIIERSKMEKESILDARIVKTIKGYDEWFLIDNIFKICYKQLNSYFKVDRKMIDERIDDLAEREYLEKEDNKIKYSI